MRIFLRCWLVIGFIPVTSCAEPAKGTIVTNVTKQVPYELIVHLVVDQQPVTIEHAGECKYYVSDYGLNPAGVTSTSTWADDLPGAVAAILPNGEAAVVELPNLCPGPAIHAGEKPAEIDSRSPVGIVPENYTPSLIWIHDVGSIDSFQLYPSIRAAPDAPLHARVVSIDIHPTDSANHHKLTEPSSAEVSLAQRFGWRTSIGQVQFPYDFRSYVAEVVPKAFWSKDPVLDQYFSHLNHIVVFDAATQDEALHLVNFHYIKLLNLSVAHFWGVPPISGSYGSGDGAYYEIPLALSMGSLVLDPSDRGVRLYKKVDNAREPYPELTYKNVKLKFGERLYDPETQQLIDFVPLTIRR